MKQIQRCLLLRAAFYLFGKRFSSNHQSVACLYTTFLQNHSAQKKIVFVCESSNHKPRHGRVKFKIYPTYYTSYMPNKRKCKTVVSRNLKR